MPATAHRVHRLVADRSCGDPAGPAHNAGDADTAFVDVPLGTAIGTGRAPAGVVAMLRTVVRGEIDQRVLDQPHLFELGQESSDLEVHLRNRAEVASSHQLVGGGTLDAFAAVLDRVGFFTEIFVEFLKSRIRSDRNVGFVHPDEGHERLRAVPSVVQPVDRLAGHNLGLKALEFACGFTVADECPGVVVEGVAVTQPGPEAVIARCGQVLAFVVELTSGQVPLADQKRVVARVGEQCCDRRLGGKDVQRIALPYEIVDSDAVRHAPGQERGPRRRAVGRGGVALCELHAFGCQTVEVGRLDHGISEAGQIAIAEIIGEDEENVGGPSLLLPRGVRGALPGRRRFDGPWRTVQSARDQCREHEPELG